MTEVLRQMEATGYLPRLSQIDLREDSTKLYARCEPVLVSLLRGDVIRFQCNDLVGHQLHADLGPNRVDFRAYRGALGPDYRGSLQIVVSQSGPPPWPCYADIDRFNLQDVVNMVGHTAGVVSNRVKGWFT